MNLSLQLLFHGAIVLLIGSLSGIPYGSAITQKKDEEVVRAWRVAHSGLSMGGTTMIAFAAAINQLDINAKVYASCALVPFPISPCPLT